MIFNRVQEGDVADLILFWRPFGNINLREKRLFEEHYKIGRFSTDLRII